MFEDLYDLDLDDWDEEKEWRNQDRKTDLIFLILISSIVIVSAVFIIYALSN